MCDNVYVVPLAVLIVSRICAYVVLQIALQSVLILYQSIRLSACAFRHLPLFSFYARKQLCFQRVLAIAILSVCPSVCPSDTRVDQSKTVQDKITKSSTLVVCKTLVSGGVKLFHKFDTGHPEQGR